MATGTTAPEHVYGDPSGVGLPSGFRVFTTMPDFLMILEWVFGGLVWILIASTTIAGTALLQGWVMFVSVLLFVMTTVLLIMYLIGAHGGQSSLTSLDAFLHCTAALFYLSAAVLQAFATIFSTYGIPRDYKVYGENVAAVVFAFLATLLYVIHAFFSLIRWKRSG